jgi:Fungal specific transcription factor domain
VCSLIHRQSDGSKVILNRAGETLWEQLGDLSTRIFALGAHREPKKPTDLPLFLVQMRKRLFASSYQIDKSIATFLGRPPRLSSRHSDCGLPLCISDDLFNASNGVFKQATESVDERGWSTQPTFQPAAWIRLRCSNAIFREEILDMSMKAFDTNTIKQLK